MGQGKELTTETIEAIRFAYLETGGKIRDVARKLGVSPETVRKYGPAPDDDLRQLRTDKTADIIELLAEAQAVYLRHLAQPRTVREASARDAATVFGILTDKRQLLSGGATERHDHRHALDDAVRRIADAEGLDVAAVLAEAEGIVAGGRS